MAYPVDCVSDMEMVDLANRDVSVIVGDASRFIVQKSPFMSAVSTGTASNRSETLRSVSFERALPAASLVRPEFVNTAALCGTAGGQDQAGSTEFEFRVNGLRGRGPAICFETARTAWAQTYNNIVLQVKQGMREVIDADVKATLLDLGGSKLVCAEDEAFEDVFAGEYNALGTPFPAFEPDSPLSFKALRLAAETMREDLDAEPFDASDDEGTGLFIGSQNCIDRFRDELDIREDFRALTMGSYKMGKDSITGYRFKGPVRGISFAVDPLPYRSSEVDGDGQPILIEPLLATDVTVGVAGRKNPDWVAATDELAFLIFKNSFRRLTPEDYTVPGFDFPASISNRGLKFKVLDDADCNLFGDYGVHLYQIMRGWKPERPASVCAIWYSRCTKTTDLTICPA